MSRMRALGGYCALVAAMLLAFANCQQSPPTGLIVIDTFPATGSSQNDTYLTLIDASGAVLAQDDNGFPDQATYVGYSRIVVSGGLGSGTYYIKVHKPTALGNPNYGLRVLDYDPGSSFPAVAAANESESPAYFDDAVNADGVPLAPRTISLGAVVSWSINPEPDAPPADVDWYKLVIP